MAQAHWQRGFSAETLILTARVPEPEEPPRSRLPAPEAHDFPVLHFGVEVGIHMARGVQLPAGSPAWASSAGSDAAMTTRIIFITFEWQFPQVPVRSAVCKGGTRCNIPLPLQDAGAEHGAGNGGGGRFPERDLPDRKADRSRATRACTSVCSLDLRSLLA